MHHADFDSPRQGRSDTGALAWYFEGSIENVAEAKERIEDRVNVNNQYRKARDLVCRLFSVPDWAMDMEWEQSKSTEQKLDIVGRVLGMFAPD